MADLSTSQWLATEAKSIRQRQSQFDECDGVSKLFDEDTSSTSSEDDMAALFSAHRGLWRSFEYYASQDMSGHGDAIWSSGELVASRILDKTIDVEGLRVLECGAGTGLPSIAASRRGARLVVATDAPTPASIYCLSLSGKIHKFEVRPLLWGNSLIEHEKFDLVVAADCIYNPQHHASLLRTIRNSLADANSRALVAFAFHGNAPDEQILEFFALAEISGFDVRYEGATQMRPTESMKNLCCISSSKRARVHTYYLSIQCPER